MKYTIKSTVHIRAGMKRVEYKDPQTKQIVTNIRGKYDVGKVVDVLEVVTDGANETWGRVSEPDATGQSLWITIRTINREFAEPTHASAEELEELRKTTDMLLLVNIVKDLQRRMTAVEIALKINSIF